MFRQTLLACLVAVQASEMYPDFEHFCKADLDYDSYIDGKDLAILLGYWGNALPCAPCPNDPTITDYCPDDLAPEPTGDGTIDGADLAILLGNWNSCVQQSTPPSCTKVYASPPAVVAESPAMSPAAVAESPAMSPAAVAESPAMAPLVPPEVPPAPAVPPETPPAPWMPVRARRLLDRRLEKKAKH